MVFLEKSHDFLEEHIKKHSNREGGHCIPFIIIGHSSCIAWGR